MLITGFSVLEEDAKDVGLSGLSMTRLGKFVALTGKNGAGKSRVLDLLQFSADHYINHSKDLESWLQSIASLEKIIQQNQDSWRRVGHL